MEKKPLLVIGASLLVIYLFTYNGCDNRFAGALNLRAVKIDTWDEWRAYLQDPSGGFQIHGGTKTVSFDTDSIRRDFVRAFHEYLIQGYVENFPEESSQEALQDLVLLKLLGVWAEGTHLQIHYRAWVELEPDEEFFRRLVLSYQRYVKAKREELSEENYPLYVTVRSLFSKLTLHGQTDQRATIELPFTFEKYKGKPNMPEL